MKFEFEEVSRKNNKKWYVIGFLLVIWHAVLAWGAYFMPIAKPEDAPEMKPCLAKYDLAQLLYVPPDALADDLNKAVIVAGDEGYLVGNDKEDALLVSNILVNKFNWPKVDADAVTNNIVNQQSSFYNDCVTKYKVQEQVHWAGVFVVKSGNGWMGVGPDWIYQWSTIFNHGSNLYAIFKAVRGDEK